MAKQHIVVSERGIESVETRVLSVSDAIAAGQLAERTALSLRLLHDSAKATELDSSSAQPIPYLDALLGSFTFRCVCGRRFIGPWEEARVEAINHVEFHHASKDVKRDLDSIEYTIEALIIPSPLYPWDELQEDK